MHKSLKNSGHTKVESKHTMAVSSEGFSSFKPPF